MTRFYLASRSLVASSVMQSLQPGEKVDSVATKLISTLTETAQAQTRPTLNKTARNCCALAQSVALII